MSNNPKDGPPIWQKIYDSPLKLTILGAVVMFAFYTIWGMVEILNLPPATLP